MSNFPQPLSYMIDGQNYDFQLIAKTDLRQYKLINIFASGPSLQEQDFHDFLLNQACIFVNGSISLLSQHQFTQVVGYVISDARFIEHALPIIHKYYSGQPWFITLSVLHALIKHAPELVARHHQSIRLIFDATRPIIYPKPSILKKLAGYTEHAKTAKRKLLNNHSSNFIVQSDKPLIGVSINITEGFVEAGTVAFVASQLAFSMQAEQIHLYGIDLVNSNQPRFYEDDNNKAPCKLEKAVAARILPAFDLLAKEYQKHGCVVFNHSPISKDLFKHIEFVKNAE